MFLKIVDTYSKMVLYAGLCMSRKIVYLEILQIILYLL